MRTASGLSKHRNGEGKEEFGYIKKKKIRAIKGESGVSEPIGEVDNVAVRVAVDQGERAVALQSAAHEAPKLARYINAKEKGVERR